MIELSTPHLIKEHDFIIDTKTTIYKIRFDFDHIYNWYSKDIKNGDMVLPEPLQPIIQKERNRVMSFEIAKNIERIKLDLNELNEKIETGPMRL